jgi:hypothetical protein
MNNAWLLELSDGEEMVVEKGTQSSFLSLDPRERALETRRQAIQAFDDAADAEAGQ